MPVTKKSPVVKKNAPASKAPAAKNTAKKSVSATATTKKTVAKPPVKEATTKNVAAKPAAQKAAGDLLSEFFVNELKDIYWAEKHLIKVLTKMEKSATAPALKQAFAGHRKVTEGHAERLEQIFGLLNQKPVAKKCEAMAGITKEGEDIISETEKGTETRDVGLIFAGQKVEHYEIATYGSLAALAKTLKLDKVVPILEATLNEEKEADEDLSKIAMGKVNEAASHEGEKPGLFERVTSMFS